MKIVKWGAMTVAGLFLLLLVIGVTRSDKDNFEGDARSLVEKQVGGEAEVTSIQVYDHGNGNLTSCGRVSYQPQLMGSMGVAGKVDSPFFVQKNGVVLIGEGDMMSVVNEAIADGCELKSPNDAGSNAD